MARRRKNDMAMPVTPSNEEHVSHTIRKISNGYIHFQTHSSGDSYSSKETYHATKPAMPAVAPAKTTPAKFRVVKKTVKRTARRK